MAITTSERTKLTQLAVSMFAAAPGAYLAELADTYVLGGKNLTNLASALSTEGAFKANFPSFSSNEEIAAKMVAQYGITSTTSGIGLEAYNYFNTQLAAGATIGSLYVAANEFISTTTLSNWAAPKALFNNQVKIAEYYTINMNGDTKDLGTLKSILANITSSTDVSSSAAIEAYVNTTAGGMTIPGKTLTVLQDILTGTAGNDVFNGYIFDNQNTFQSGDIINGGSGTDSLYIELGASQKFAITAKTNSVENIYIRNQSNGSDSVDNGTNASEVSTTQSDIDAQDMVGVRELWSVDSRADLRIEDVRASSHLTTIGLRNTDAGDVDYEVYFDHATASDGTTAGSQLFLRILDLQSMELSASTSPLGTNPYNGVTFKVDGVTITAKAPAAFTGTFASMVAELNANLASNGYSNLTVALGTNYTAIKADTGVSYVGTELIITNSASGVLTTGSWTTPDGTSPATNNTYTTQSTTPPSTTTTLTSVEAVLDNVGRGSQSGDFVIGLITDNNENNGAQQPNEGIQQFNVHVDRNSWIDTLASTENVLRVVNVDNITTNNAAGNGSVRIDNLVDVKTFNASTMVGAVNLTATIADTAVAKYMNTVDTAVPSADNVSFAYTTGAGNDTLNLTIGKGNLETAGTTTREDFNLAISTGNGDDTVTTMIGTGTGVGTEAWYINSKLNANLAISTGEGADTVNAKGAGDFSISTGAGSDTVYVDNTGAQAALVKGVATGNTATWVVNTADQTAAAGTPANVLGDLISDTNGSSQLYKANMTVTFKGLTATAVIGSTNYFTSDLQINNAIKAAINSDAVLSKLIVAKDGPANTLVITALSDGLAVVADLAFAITAPTAALTAAELTAVNTAWGTGYATGAELTAMNATGTALTAATASYDAVFAESDSAAANIVGADSAAVNDSTIVDGTGNDVYVLSTTGDAVGDAAFLAANTASTSQNPFSNNTITFAAAFGNDTIVNFKADTDFGANEFSAGYDILNLKAFLGTAATTFDATVGAMGATVNSEVAILARVSNNDTVLDAGENDSAAAVKALYTDGVVATKSVYISYNAAGVGSVYSVVDGTGTADLTVTLQGTIDLADTAWSTLTIGNLA